MDTIIFGGGPLGAAIAGVLADRGTPARPVGRPPAGRHDPATLGRPVAAIDATRGDAVLGNIEAALAAGCRRFVIATTGWDADRPAVEDRLRASRGSGVAAPNFSLGAAVFGRLVDRATDLLGPIDDFEPYVVEWHRRAKADRPSGTARDLADRIIARHPAKTAVAAPSGPASPSDLELAVIRAGSSPGMHLVGFDAAGETIELRLTARDRRAYALGVLASLEWLAARRRPAGLHAFDAVVDELFAPALAATA